jgi:tRNA threonylcarbamoyladenosine biosynthesis protein TsaE
MSHIYEIVCDEAHVKNLAKKVISDVGLDGIILLRGNLASGKTAFVKAFASALRIKEEISSPTFSILHEYEGQLFHYDIYQCGVDGFLKSGLVEKLDCVGYHLIEWGESEFEALLRHFGITYSTIDITTESSKRRYKVNIHAYT